MRELPDAMHSFLKKELSTVFFKKHGTGTGPKYERSNVMCYFYSVHTQSNCSTVVLSILGPLFWAIEQ